jgi:hypothetical protein
MEPRAQKTFQEYREQAEHARKMAAMHFNGADRETLPQIAQQHETLATITERGLER